MKLYVEKKIIFLTKASNLITSPIINTKKFYSYLSITFSEKQKHRAIELDTMLEPLYQ